MLTWSHRNVWLLVGCMGTIQTLATAQVSMASLIGHSLAEDKALATLPIAIWMTAAGASAAAYGAMNLVMTSTPLEMMLCGFTVNDSARVIQYHALAMFGPSFVTGSLIARFGHARMILAGAVLILGCAVVGVAGQDFLHFVAALVLLGLGWNFMFIAGSALQAEAWAPAERPKAQAVNDLIVFSTVTLTAFGSGAAHDTLGWAAVTFGMLPAVLGAAVAVPLLLRTPAAAPATR